MPDNAQIRHKAAIRKDNEKKIMYAAEQVFARVGFKGATMEVIAKEAGVPKANIHYYFRNKRNLYSRVIADVCTEWTAAAQDPSLPHPDPVAFLAPYIRAKMRFSRTRPSGSKIWAVEMLAGADLIKEHVGEDIRLWFENCERLMQTWIDEGKMTVKCPKTAIWMMWATTQHYADFDEQINYLNKGPVTDDQYADFSDAVVDTLLRGFGLHQDQK